MKDQKILKELRNGPMKNMKDEEYAMIEEQVNQNGIAGLKGYAKSMIEKAMRDMAYSMKKALEDVEKHGGGSHDQASHGSWAGNGAGGKNIQDMSLDDQKEFIDRMSSAKSGEEQRAIIDEFKGRQKGGAKGKSTGDSLSTKGASIKNKLNKIDAEKLSDRDVTSRNRAVKLIDKANKHLEDAKNKSGSPRDTALLRAQDALAYAFEELDGADSMQLQSVSESIGMFESTIQSKMGKSAESLPSVEKANSVKQGDMVSWNSSGGSAQGKVVRVISSGKINVPDSSFSIEGSEDDPAALIQLYRDGKPTDTKVGHKVSTLKKA